MARASNHNPLIDETSLAGTVRNAIAAIAYLDATEPVADDLSQDARTGRWVLVNAVTQALIYEIARMVRLRKLEGRL